MGRQEQASRGAHRRVGATGTPRAAGGTGTGVGATGTASALPGVAWPVTWLALLPVALAAMLLGVLALRAAAEPPGRLAQPVTDTVGALSGGMDEVQAALAELQSAEGIQLWVAYVDTFDGLSGQQWAEQTAQRSGLGGNDLLFAVAIGDRAYGYSVSDQGVDEGRLERVLARDVEPELGDGDWPGAVVALAEGLGSGAGSSAGSSGAGSAVPLVLGGAVVLVLGVVVVAALRRRSGASAAAGRGRAASAAAAPPAEPIERVRQAAAEALIDADDSLKTSEQELGFAVAQFGERAAEPFAAALSQSKAELAQAFRLQQQAQAGADTPQERGLLEQIVSLCRQADARLDEQVEDFDALRDLDRTIDSVLPHLADQATSLDARLDTARTTAEHLAGQYPAEALTSVSGNVEQAAQRLQFAHESLATGGGMLSSGDRNGAVAHARAAEESLGQATTLLDAVDRAPSELAQAEQAIAALVAETAKDVAEAEQLLSAASPAVNAAMARAHQFASETLAWARTVVASGRYDPLATRRALEESDSALEATLAPARAEQQRRARAATLLTSATEAARASIQAADDFIVTRRGAVGAEARTRLAQAQRLLATATSLPDPEAALAQVQQADHLADQALALAQQDESRYRDAAQRTGSAGGLSDIVLGGILLDSMMRGGRRGGGFPGMGRPSGGLGGGRPVPGSFGGGGTRARRSGGGRF